MAVDIEELIIAPFQEVVARGKDAVVNAEAAVGDDDETSTRMAKAGKAVLREGERALKRLQPLWDSQVEKYGEAFKLEMSKNEEIEDKRRKLEDLLYDFEDYVEMDTFDEDKFTQLQTATKSLALDVLDTIRRLKVDGVPISPPPKVTMAFPPLPPLPPSALQAAAKPRSPSSTANSNPSVSDPTTGGRDSLPPGTEHSSRSRRPSNTASSGSTDGRKRRQPQGLLRSDTNLSHASSRYSVDTLPPYSSYSAHTVPPVCEIAPPAAYAEAAEETALPQHAERPQPSDTQQAAALGARASAAQRSNPVRLVNEPSILNIPTFPLPRTTAWVTDQASVATASPRFAPQPLPIRRAVVPEGQAVTTMIGLTNTENINLDRSLSPLLSRSDRFSVEGSLATRSPSEASPSPVVTTPGTSTRSSGYSRANSAHDASSKSHAVRPPDVGGRSSSLASAPPVPPPLRLPPAAEFDEGLMAADDWRTVISDGPESRSRGLSSVSSRETDCSIGVKSSLYQMKGFCEGAQAFRQGGHMQGVKKTQGYVAGATAHTGKCISCGYAHHYDELALDVNRDTKANFFYKSDVRFRIRFLYKSHLTTQKMTEGYYGCLFCAQVGSVVREGDATVFANSDALLRHLARHPQPLPEVPGLTVLYGKEFPEGDARLNDFDLHFLEPPSTTNLGVAADMARLPVATATKMHVQRYGEKKLPRPDGKDEKDLLQFFVGARIVGVEFPWRWAGKWASGYHDGQWGFFPAKNVELEQPRGSEMQTLMTQAGSGAVTTRWKWEPRDASGKGWLAFDKGETITNVGWIFKEHWCWSGTNSKGQLGLFPRSHVQFDKVKEDVLLSPIGSPVGLRPASRSANSLRTKVSARHRFFGRRKNTAAQTRSSASSISRTSSSVVELVI